MITQMTWGANKQEFFDDNQPNEKLLYQSKTDSCKYKKLYVVTEFLNMHSTHRNNFNGGQLILGYQASPRLSIGLGTKFAYTKYHFDNEWHLHRLKFFPVFIDWKINAFSHPRTVTPFLHFSQGASYITYHKEDKHTMGRPYKVSEWGLYLYGGFGAVFRISEHFAPVIEMGFQGFHMSSNQMAVNPHGTTIQIGFVW